MLGKLTELVLFGLAPFLVGGMLIPVAHAQESTITGEVFYRERIALPPDAVLTIQLADVSLADAPASIIAEQTIEPAGQVPIKFSLAYDRGVLRPQVSYAVQARIMVDNHLWYINDERQAFDPASSEPLQILVRRVGNQAADTPPPITDVEWIVEDEDGSGKRARMLTIASDGRLTGHGGCNGFFADAKVEGDALTIGPIGSTFMACEQPVMEKEKAFLDSLGKVAGFRVDDEGRLHLLAGDGAELLTLVRQE